MNIEISDPQYNEKMLLADMLSQVMDPELGINIIDLGLIYNIELNKAGKEILITMTLSTPSCPAGGMIKNNVESVIKDLYPAHKVSVDITFQPQWSFDMITEDGRIALGW